MNPHRVHVLNGTDDHYVVILVTKQLQFVFFPPQQGFVDKHFMNRGGFQSALQQSVKFLGVVHDGGSVSTQRK